MLGVSCVDPKRFEARAATDMSANYSSGRCSALEERPPQRDARSRAFVSCLRSTVRPRWRAVTILHEMPPNAGRTARPALLRRMLAR